MKGQEFHLYLQKILAISTLSEIYSTQHFDVSDSMHIISSFNNTPIAFSALPFIPKFFYKIS